MTPTNAPVEVIDFRNLAHRFEMSGGYIKNAVLRAAFLAGEMSVRWTAPGSAS